MSALLLRVKNILIRPRHEWRVIKDEPATYASLIFRYVGVLAAVPPAAAVAGRAVFDRGIAGNAVHNPLPYVIAANILWYIMIIVDVLITAAVIAAVVAAVGFARIGLRG